MANQEKELTRLLGDAADEREGAAEAFFELLLRSTVYVPLEPGISSEQASAAAEKPVVVGEGAQKALGYLSVLHEGKELIPIFTEQDFVAVWAKKEVESVAVTFKYLIWAISDDISLYLNPEQEVGKELTPWEIERLKEGADAIAELVAELSEDRDEGIEVRSHGEIFPELQTKLLPILEIYPELREAFMIALKDYSSADERPVLGIRYANIPEAKRLYLRAEFEAVANDNLRSHLQMMVCDDLGEANSPNEGMIRDATPFYVASAEPPADSPIKKLFSSLSGRGRSKKK